MPRCRVKGEGKGVCHSSLFRGSSLHGSSSLCTFQIIFANPEIEPTHEGGFEGMGLGVRAGIETAEQVRV